MVSYYIPPQKNYATSIPQNTEIAKKNACDVMLSSFAGVCVCARGTMFSRIFFSRILSDLIQQSGWVCPVDSVVMALGVRDVQ